MHTLEKFLNQNNTKHKSKLRLCIHEYRLKSQACLVFSWYSQPFLLSSVVLVLLTFWSLRSVFLWSDVLISFPLNWFAGLMCIIDSHQHARPRLLSHQIKFVTFATSAWPSVMNSTSSDVCAHQLKGILRDIEEHMKDKTEKVKLTLSLSFIWIQIHTKGRYSIFQTYPHSQCGTYQLSYTFYILPRLSALHSKWEVFPAVNIS